MGQESSHEENTGDPMKDTLSKEKSYHMSKNKNGKDRKKEENRLGSTSIVPSSQSEAVSLKILSAWLEVELQGILFKFLC